MSVGATKDFGNQLMITLSTVALGYSVALHMDVSRRGLTRLLTWAGLRGGLALALAMSLPASTEKSLILNMTFAVVAFSILVQGSTIGTFFKPAYLKGLIISG